MGARSQERDPLARAGSCDSQHLPLSTSNSSESRANWAIGCLEHPTSLGSPRPLLRLITSAQDLAERINPPWLGRPVRSSSSRTSRVPRTVQAFAYLWTNSVTPSLRAWRL